MRGANGARLRWAAAAVGGLLFGAGCVTTSTKAARAPHHTIDIVFERRCPVDAKPHTRERLADEPTGRNQRACEGKPRCLVAGNKETVSFRATTAEGKPTDHEFELQFDPFKKAPLKAGNGHIELEVEVYYQGQPKTFTYNVLSGTCTPLDPQIIIDY